MTHDALPISARPIRPAGRSRLSPSFGVYARESLAEIIRSLRAPQFVLPSILMPGGFYALFALGLGKGGATGIATSMVLYGIFAAIGPALFGFGAGLAFDRERGLLDGKRVAPLPVGAIFAAKLAAAMAVTALALLPIYAAGSWGGARFGPLQWGMLFVIDLATVIPFGLLGIALGLAMSGRGAVAVANILFMAFSIFGGLWIPFRLLPHWMQVIGWFTPSYHLGAMTLQATGLAPPGGMAGHGLFILLFVAAMATLAHHLWRRLS